MNDGIRIRISIGLILVAVIQALLPGVVFNALHSRSPVKPTEKPWSIAPYQGVAPTTTKIEKLDQPQSVNVQSQDEIALVWRLQLLGFGSSGKPGRFSIVTFSIIQTAAPTDSVL